MSGPEPFFLTIGGTNRFCVLHDPDARHEHRGAIFFVHAFGEEMNRSRRMVALQAHALASVGWTVLLMDLLGCGDSDTDFGNATWQYWLDDTLAGVSWLEGRSGFRPALWGLRAGCLLATQAASTMPSSPNLILWQPVLSGRQFLHQVLRLKLTANILGPSSSQPAGRQEMYDLLMRGESVEIAGYAIAPALAFGLEKAELDPPATRARAAWLEIAPGHEADLAPASRSRVQQWREAGWSVCAEAVQGQQFWQTIQTSECPSLIDATMRALADWDHDKRESVR